MKRQHWADLALIIATINWGFSYIFIKNAIVVLETFNLLGIRFLLSALGLALIFHKRLKNLDKVTRNGGILVGILLFSAYAAHTFGLKYTTISKSAFITGFAAIIVPILSALLFKKIPSFSTIIGVIIAFIGITLLTLNGETGWNIGDSLTLISAFFFAFQILMVGYYARKVDTINFTIVQISVIGILSIFASFLFESPQIPVGKDIWISLVFLILICTIMGFIIQNVAQKYTSPTHASLIFSSEPFFASIFAYLLMGEALHPKGILGGFLIVLGILAAEFNFHFDISKFKKNPCIQQPQNQDNPSQ